MALKETALTQWGEETPRVVIYKSESHKLHQAFMVKTGKNVLAGQPVALNTDGTIQPLTGASSEIYLGIAATDSLFPAYAAQRNAPAEVTVMVEGFVICNRVAATTVTAGYVTVDGTTLNDHFTKCKNTTSGAASNFIALNSGDANEVVQVLCK